LPTTRSRTIAALTACLTLALSACATTSPGTTGSGEGGALSFGGGGERDLSADEKKTIMAAVAPSLRDAGSAKYHWAKFPTAPPDGSVNYCAVVDAKSQFAAYNGRQAYIVETKVVGGRVASATIGLIAGGKDFALVTRMCAKYGLDPNHAS